MKKTEQVIRATLEAEPRLIKEKGIQIGVSALADSSVNFVVRPWVKTEDYWGVYFDLLQAIKEELDKENIGIPYPQITFK